MTDDLPDLADRDLPARTPDDAPRVALVTGGSRGIGAATVRAFLDRGFHVCFTYRQQAGADALLASLPTSAVCRGVRADATDEADTERAFDAAEAMGRVTVLVNNAGATRHIAPLASWSTAMVRDVLEVNLVAPLLACGVAARRWAADPTGRSIVNISSGAATTGSPHEYVPYAAAKAGVDALTVGLAKELAPLGIRVNAVAAGITDTGIHADAGDPGRGPRVAATVPMRRMARPEEIAEAVAWLASDAASYVSGAVLRATGGA